VSPVLFACDLDGTLLTSDGLITARTRAAVRSVQEAGHVFVLATGRPVRDVLPIVRDLRCSPLAVCGNGSITYDFAAQAVVDYAAIPAAALDGALASLRALLPGIRFGAERHLEFLLEDGFQLPSELLAPAVTGPDLAGLLDARGVGKLIVQASGDAADYHEAVRAALPEGFEVTRSTSLFCEVTRSGVDKAAALARLAAALGVPDHATVAFGDMPNDLPMLRWAAVAVAVGNAHPEVSAAAQEHTATNDEDGVARWLQAALPMLDPV
jgi:hydroxymethylpyrimidine pyrophosphatase-like HAD family hydrolase